MNTRVKLRRVKRPQYVWRVPLRYRRRPKRC